MDLKKIDSVLVIFDPIRLYDKNNFLKIGPSVCVQVRDPNTKLIAKKCTHHRGVSFLEPLIRSF